MHEYFRLTALQPFSFLLAILLLFAGGAGIGIVVPLSEHVQSGSDRLIADIFNIDKALSVSRAAPYGRAHEPAFAKTKKRHGAADITTHSLAIVPALHAVKTFAPLDLFDRTFLPHRIACPRAPPYPYPSRSA